MRGRTGGVRLDAAPTVVCKAATNTANAESMADGREVAGKRSNTDAKRGKESWGRCCVTKRVLKRRGADFGGGRR
jgi:hypothetical protein